MLRSVISNLFISDQILQGSSRSSAPCHAQVLVPSQSLEIDGLILYPVSHFPLFLGHNTSHIVSALYNSLFASTPKTGISCKFRG